VGIAGRRVHIGRSNHFSGHGITSVV
jgi:hypothetical protein